MIKLKSLSYFKAVVEYGSVTAAAEVLHIAQPPLSKALSLLEQQWNIKLFERSSHGMLPTEAGRYLYQHACTLLQMSSDLEEKMHGFGDGQRGMVRIGTVSMGIPRVAKMMKSLRQTSPDLSFSLFQGDMQHLEELLERRQIDAALVHLPLTPSDAQLSMQPLAHASFRALCHPDSPLAQYTSLNLTQLAAQPLVLLRRKSGFGVYEKVLQCFAKAGLSAQIFANASDVSMLKYLVQQNMAIALLPMLPEEQEWGELLTIPVPEMDSVADDLVVIYRAVQETDSALRAVINFFTATNAQTSGVSTRVLRV